MPDIIPPRKSIRDIPLPEGRQPIVPPPTGGAGSFTPPPPPVSTAPLDDYPPRRPYVTEKKGSRKLLWIILAAVIIGVGLAIFFLYSKATLAIVLKNQTIPVDLTATSTKDGVNSSIPYSIITLEKSESVELSGTVSNTQVSKKASGTITIYNNYSTASQDLVATTRFQTPGGLVYRIDKDITVPGQTTSNGQTVPGSIDAVVYADQPGSQYNVGKTDFIIPGFQGTAKASGFYAKSKTDITGGYVGNATSVSDDEMNTKTEAIKNTIQQELIAQAKSETPDTFIFFPTGLIVNFTSEATTTDGKTMLVGRGVAFSPIFNKALLTDTINKASNTNYAVLDGWEGLQVQFDNTQGLISGEAPAIQVHLSGNLTVGQDINIGELQRALAGKPKTDLPQILNNYTSILSANATIRPFWKTSFPNDAQKINVNITKAP